jgi:hypothetical protein
MYMADGKEPSADLQLLFARGTKMPRSCRAHARSILKKCGHRSMRYVPNVEA